MDSVNESSHGKFDNKKRNRFAVRMQKHMDGSSGSKEKERESGDTDSSHDDSKHGSAVSRKNTEQSLNSEADNEALKNNPFF